jgi:hypothetical protein
MIHPSIIESRLGELRFRGSRWFNAEIQELQHILMDNEKIIALACGRYFGSFALLVATDHRLLVIDKRVFFMNMESTSYDMVSEIDFNSQVYNATLTVFTINKAHKFTSMKYKHQLRDIANYTQKRIAELRNQSSTVPMPQSVLSQLQPSMRRQSRPQRFRPSQAPAGPAYNARFDGPRQMAAQPTDYYVDDNTSDDGHMIRERVGHIAHIVGSAATNAAHHHPTASFRRPVNPYLQGSLMSRGSIGSNLSQNY